jgi:sterol desaturase/sphingolipid hydroxylase (fatty acid hydroxylase superfamily)
VGTPAESGAARAAAALTMDLTDLRLVRTTVSTGMLVALFAWETFAPYFPFFAGQWRRRSIHAFRNLLLGVINALVVAALFVTLWLLAAEWAARNQFGLLHWLGLRGGAHTLGAILLFDGWMYGWHRLNHALPFLWRFHRTHHSDPFMDVTTASRFHLGEIILSSVLRAPVIALIGMHLWQVLLYESLMFLVVQLHHANIGLPAALDRWLRLLIVTPAMHKVHHSRWQPETDSNYSSLFSLWDRCFRSFRLRDDPRTIRFGLEDYDAPEHQHLRGLLATPLRKTRPARETPAVRPSTPPLREQGRDNQAGEIVGQRHALQVEDDRRDRANQQAAGRID